MRTLRKIVTKCIRRNCLQKQGKIRNYARKKNARRRNAHKCTCQKAAVSFSNEVSIYDLMNINPG